MKLFGWAWLALAAAAWLSVSPRALAFTASNAAAMFNAYRDAFYFEEGSNGYFRATTQGGKTWFWERAEQMEMLLDVHERTRNPAALTLFSNVFNGFISDHGRSWAGNDFNDDIMWMVIACARGFQVAPNPAWREAAKANFDLCYSRAWSTNLGGGLFWKTSNLSKNACVNGPGAIAACLLSQICGDAGYLDKARSLYLWERATLFDTNSGAVADNISLSGRVDPRSMSYNQGTFIGAAHLLGYTNDARLAADYTLNTLGRRGLLPGYGESGDGGGFNGICVRWLARFMRDRGLEGRYLAFLQRNAAAAWAVRRAADGLSWPHWSRPTPPGTLHSWGCSSSVVAMHVVPPAGPAPTAPDLVWTGRATNARGGLLATFTVNTENAPDLAAWGRRAGELCVEWYPKMTEALASEGFTPPNDVRLEFRNDYDGVAATSRDKIVISAGYVRRASNDFGMVIHELTHVAQDYGNARNPGWLVEGVADYIRISLFEPQARRPRIDPARASYRDSYKTTAIFLEWAQNKYDPRLVMELNRAMRNRVFKIELFQERTGRTVDELWAEFTASLRETKS